MLIQIHPENPGHRQITKLVEALSRGGIIIYPTDTVYGMGCDIRNTKGIEKIARIKGASPKRPGLSFIFSDLSQISEYTMPVDNSVFKLIKRHLPGPFTFILNANNKLPKILKSRKKTIGIRIPDSTIIRDIVRELGRPVLSTSIHDADEIIEYTTDPELIYEKYQNIADIVINGGYGKNEASTIVDCTGEEPEIIRQGLGLLDY